MVHPVRADGMVLISDNRKVLEKLWIFYELSTKMHDPMGGPDVSANTQPSKAV